ncbi:Wzz/FepE/Etk N-terminal domain-containing protein [Geodermatophilus sp. URMC 61]|uniref:Wzz/FepE/Etk N-terminal domain-containing protein n=1 Tax=Geodermatophilus sp. URMC 61 TaxID=3423411 RepID=UPI00406CA01B
MLHSPLPGPLERGPAHEPPRREMTAAATSEGERDLMPSENAAGAMHLSDYAVMLRRQWAVVAALTVLGALLAGGYLLVAPRSYTSHTNVLVTATTPGADTSSRQSGINLDTEAQLVIATQTVTTAADLLDLPAEEVADLADRVTVTVPPNTEILTISFVAPTAQGAQEGAEAFARAYLETRRSAAAEGQETDVQALQARIDALTAELQEVVSAGAALPADSPQRARTDERVAALNTQLADLGSQQRQVRATPITPGRVITQAALPLSPSSPDLPLTVVAGTLLGLLSGLGIGALRHRADDRIRTAEDLRRRTGVPTAAVLPGELREAEVVLAPPVGADGRAYVRLRNLVTAGLERSARRVVLVAGVRGGGATVAANLAASLARGGEDVVLVCADVHGTTAGDLLGDSPSTGLVDVLAGRQELDAVLRPLPGLPAVRVLGPGGDPHRVEPLLQARRLRVLVDRLLGTASVVVIAAPATTQSLEAQTLAPVAEAALLVVEPEVTVTREVTDALDCLEAVHRPVLGAVLTGRAARGGARRARQAAAPERGARADGRVPAGAGRAAAPARPGPRDSALR